MIDYRIFQVACPPLTGAKWLVQAAQLCGLGPGFTEHIYGLFPKEHSGLLRVSLVRHPCDWLTACYAHFQQGDSWGSNHMQPFPGLCRDSLEAFVWNYLQHPGCIGQLFDQYEADTCLRIEDMPWAFLEVLRSLDVPRVLIGRLTGKPRLTPSAFSPELRGLILQAEENFAERYDYW